MDGRRGSRWLCCPLQACNRQGLYCVPLYDSLGENAVEYILDHSESSAVFVETSKMGKLAAALPDIKAPVRTAARSPSAGTSSCAVCGVRRRQLPDAAFAAWFMPPGLLQLRWDPPNPKTR